jgi:hypothetical protein
MSERNSLNRFSKSQAGAVTIEFVLTLPLFLAALAFTFEFGQFFLAHQTTVNNVRSAARFLSRVDDPESNLARADNIILTGQVSGGDPPAYLQGSCSSGCAEFKEADGTIHVRVLASYSLTIFGFVDGGKRPSLPFVVTEDLRWTGM